MACLEIRLLGPFDVSVDGDPAAGFESGSTRALLALLASEPGRAWSRPVLAEMLWPERPPGAALSNLRHVLSILRKVLADSLSDPRFLMADRNKLSLVSSSELWVDSIEFEQLAAMDPEAEGAVASWERAVGLWRGPFLEDLQVRAGAEWEEWRVVTGEQLRRLLTGVLRALVTENERAGDLAHAISFAQRLVEVDAYDERAHRQLMRLLAGTGEAAQALFVYEDLRKRFDAELAMQPAVETAALAERIRAGTIPGGLRSVEIIYPDFLTRTRTLPTTPLFVGKEKELGQLEAHLQAALSGHGRIVLISGEAGSGKTMLAGEFARRAMAPRDVLVANGRCNAYGGLGDPYLPFREVLGLLTGDVESDFASGTIGREQATRLWEAVPDTARLVLERGPSLVGVMVNGSRLVERSRQAVPEAEWLDGLQSRAEAAADRPPTPERMQPALFDEYTAVLAGLTATHPLVVVVDDLQWGDHGSIALLWHLARHLVGQRLLIVGLYRPEEIDSEHPLRQLLGELQTSQPESTLELGGDRSFIDAFLDSEPNQLDAGFREQLYSYTDGHPLLTVEMVRGMQERAEIRRNRAGLWITSEPPAWQRIPTRVGAVIAQRIGRLPNDLQDDLAVAAVQGEEFIAETVAAVRGDDGITDRLRIETRMPHRLVAPSGAFRIGDQLSTKYRFRHILFQRYLYGRLAAADRLRLHERTGRALETLYRESADPPVVDLAHHFDQAGLLEPAIAYLQRAGQRAFRMAANEEALRLIRRALDLLMSSPMSPERDRHELELLVALSASVMAIRGYTAPESDQIGRRVRELCRRLEPSPTAALALFGLGQVLTIQARHAEADEVCRDVVAVGNALDDSGVQMVGHYMVGYLGVWLGNLSAGRHHLRRACQIYDAKGHAWLTHALGMALGPEAHVWAAVCALHCGRPTEAFRLAEEGIAAARRLEHPFTLCHTLGIGGSALRMMAGDYETADRYAEEAAAIAGEEHFPFWITSLATQRGVIKGYLGDPGEGASAVRSGLDALHEMGVQSFRGFFYSYFADLKLMQGRPDLGLDIVERELENVQQTEEGLSEQYLLLQRGRLEAALGRTSLAIQRLEESIANAGRIGSHLLELQSATALAQLHLQEQRRHDAARVLKPIISRFTDGLDTPHLVAARSVLATI